MVQILLVVRGVVEELDPIGESSAVLADALKLAMVLREE
jgi:hypothetical protein